jgi:hypothetical protein
MKHESFPAEASIRKVCGRINDGDLFHICERDHGHAGQHVGSLAPEVYFLISFTGEVRIPGHLASVAIGNKNWQLTTLD